MYCRKLGGAGVSRIGSRPRPLMPRGTKLTLADTRITLVAQFEAVRELRLDQSMLSR